MQRVQFGNNIKSLCNSKRLDFRRDYDHIYIGTDYEIFCFELDDQDVWLSYRELKGAGKDEIVKLNKFLINPKPGKIIDTVLANITVHNEAEYVAKHFEKIKTKCNEYGMRCELRFNKVFVSTMAEEFYFEFDPYDTEMVALRHKGYNAWSKISDEYHRQFEKKMSPCEVVEYIRNHTKNKYGVSMNKARCN